MGGIIFLLLLVLAFVIYAICCKIEEISHNKKETYKIIESSKFQNTTPENLILENNRLRQAILSSERNAQQNQNESKKTISYLENKISCLRIEIDNLSLENDRLKLKLATVSESKNNQNEADRSYQQAISDMEDQISALRNETDSLSLENARLKSKLSAIAESKIDQRKASESYQQAISDMEDQISAWKAQVDKLVLENTHLRSELYSVTEENQKNKSDLFAERALYNESLESLTKTIPTQYNIEEWFERIQAGRLINALHSNLSIKNINATADVCSDETVYYGTTLTSCTCQDHKFTHRPCKHMLYLAYLLGVLQLNSKRIAETYEITIEELNKSTEKKLKIEDKIKKAAEKNKELKKISNDYLTHLDSMTKKSIADYPYFANIIAELQTYYYEQAALCLESKKRPALGEAKRIRELKNDTKEILRQKKELEYKLNYIETLFPNINDIFDSGFSEEQAFQLETEKDTDRVRLFLSPEEYKTMSISQKNQLALDRYISNRKSKWQVGRDYEMFIGYSYEQKGYNVSYTGIIKNLEDMGRDLIVNKDTETLIIQCKNWSKEKTIHEKHIFQLFGTVVLYNLDHPSAKAKGVFVSTTKLSEKALEIAKELDIQYYQIDLGNFPRIKCNINRATGEKIYHLPFDQQYDSTVVKESVGECYAFTVKEAEEKGFRRAFKHAS